MDPFFSCTAAQVPRVAWTAGGIALVSQWILTRLFLGRKQRRTDPTLPDEITKNSKQQQQQTAEAAAYLSHNVIALVLMMLVSWLGVRGYCFQHFSTATKATALGGLLQSEDNTARWLAAVLCGALLLWDVPTSLQLPQVRRQWDLIGHHLVMAGTAWLGATQLPMHFVYFYLGVAELSSIPLIVYDQLEQWTTTTTAATTSPWLVQLKEATQVVTALSFTVVRAVWFPWVTLRHFLPSVRQELLLRPQAPNNHVLLLVATGSLGFTVLQWYWFITKIALVAMATTATTRQEGECDSGVG